MATITLQAGQFGWDYVVATEHGGTIYIQSDVDYPGIAMAFGWSGDDDDIEGAQEFLDDNIGAEVDDPGYFEEAE